MNGTTAPARFISYTYINYIKYSYTLIIFESFSKKTVKCYIGTPKNNHRNMQKIYFISTHKTSNFSSILISTKQPKVANRESMLSYPLKLQITSPEQVRADE